MTRASRWAWQLPVIAVLSLGSAAVLGWQPALVVALYLAVVSPELCRIDIREHRLPNRLVGPGYIIAAAALIWHGFAEGRFPALAAGSAVAYFAFLLLLNLTGGMGLGDVKLAGVLGAGLGLIGLTALGCAVVTAFVTGGVAAGVVLMRRTAAPMAAAVGDGLAGRGEVGAAEPSEERRSPVLGWAGLGCPSDRSCWRATGAASS